MPTSGQEEKHLTSIRNLINQWATGSKTENLMKKKKNARSRADVEMWLATIVHAHKTHWKALI